jgi:hypothetical protein
MARTDLPALGLRCKRLVKFDAKHHGRIVANIAPADLATYNSLIANATALQSYITTYDQ